VGDLYNAHRPARIVNEIQDSIDAASQPVLFVSGELSRLRWARVGRKRPDGIENSADVAAGNRTKVLGTAFQKSVGTSEVLYDAGGLEGRERPSNGLQRKDVTDRSVLKRHKGEAPVEDIISSRTAGRNDVLGH